MYGSIKDQTKPLRMFRVGVVGASPDAFEALARIFSLTLYRTRCYEPVPILANATVVPDGIDFLILCTSNPNVLQYWLTQRPKGLAMAKPLIRIARNKDVILPGGYSISVPVNPARLLKILDQYTIKELNYFPEFKIGSDSSVMCDVAEQGLKLLRSESSSINKRYGLQRALIVDDSLAVRKQIEIEFGLFDVDVDCCGTAEAALDSTNKIVYDIIFLDVIMPGMDGYAACKRIRRSPLNKNTPIVLLTSRSSSFDKIKGTLAGCDTYLVKPINHNDFENVVNKYFSQVRIMRK
jgi:two-component system, cell cycle response regulator